MLIGKVDSGKERDKDAGDLHFVVEEHDHLYGRAGHHGEDKEDDQRSIGELYIRSSGKGDAQDCGRSRGLSQLARRQFELIQRLGGNSQ